MKRRYLLPLLCALTASVAPAATVLTNETGTPTTSQLVRGPGGFLGQPIALGFTFTVSHPDDWDLLTVSLNVTGISGTAPLQVELYGSPAGPDTATFISALTPPSFFTAGMNTWTAPTPVTLDSGGTYFVRVFTATSGSSYSIARTAEPLSGDWTLDAHYTQAGTNPWAASSGNAPMLSLTAVPEPTVFAALAGCLGVLLLVRRRTAGAMLLAMGMMQGTTREAAAQEVVFEFSAWPAGTGNSMNILPLPKAQYGYRFSGSAAQSFVGIPGPQHCGFVGVRSFYPQPGSGGAARVFTLDRTDGRRFSVKSLVLHPHCVGGGGTVGFTRVRTNALDVTQTVTVPTNSAGIPVVFDSQFQDITAFKWTASGGNSHEISALTLELIPEASIPATMTVAEASGMAQIPLSLTGPLGAETQVGYTIFGGTASLGSDFTLPGGAQPYLPQQGGGILTVPAGVTSVMLNIPLLNDTATESPESFSVELGNAPPGFSYPGNVSTLSTTITIASDDGIANFAGWMSAHGLTGNAALPNADPNGDGVSNIESWLCRINPAGPSPAAWLERRASYFTTAANVPGLRLTVPTPQPSDVRMIFEETTVLSPWSEQTRRSGFATGSLWTGTGASRVVESNSLTARTITLPGSASRSARPRAFFRMKYELVSGGGD